MIYAGMNYAPSGVKMEILPEIVSLCSSRMCLSAAGVVFWSLQAGMIDDDAVEEKKTAEIGAD